MTKYFFYGNLFTFGQVDSIHATEGRKEVGGFCRPIAAKCDKSAPSPLKI